LGFAETDGVLQLGGKSPAVVFDDCNLDNAVTWTVNAFTANTGQVCFAATRVYVQDGIYDEFIKRYKQGVQDKMKQIGDPDKEETVIGPLVDEAQFKRVTGYIERGQQGQGNLLVGGHRVGDKVWCWRNLHLRNSDMRTHANRPPLRATSSNPQSSQT